MIHDSRSNGVPPTAHAGGSVGVDHTKTGGKSEIIALDLDRRESD